MDSKRDAPEEATKWDGPGEVLDSYDLQGGRARINIFRSPENSEILCNVEEPKLTRKEMSEVGRLEEMIWTFIPDMAGASQDLSLDMTALIESFIHERMPWIKGELRERYMYYLNRDFNGYGIIDPLVRDGKIEDISCDGPGIPVFIFHSDFGSISTNITFRDSVQLSSFIVRLSQMCGKTISINSPLLDGITRDGHRVEAIYSGEISGRGPAFTIRLFRESPFTPAELIHLGTASPEMMAYLWMMVENLNSALIVGAPGSGKTSALNSILMFAPVNTKIFSIEDTRELNLSHQNWVAAETREIERESLTGISSFGLFDLVKVAMRQRPTYIVVGEVRGREMYALFQAMATGHTTYSTVHADSMESLMNRLENEPMNVPKLMISYLNIVIFINFVRKGEKKVRRITEIDEIAGIDSRTGDITYNRVFTHDPAGDTFWFSGNSMLLKKIAEQRSVPVEEVFRILQTRARILKDSADSKMKHSDLAETIQRSYMGDN